jgi:transcription-repair coupling factor (superfamily II helicase)
MDEFRDRFGTLPETTCNLFFQVHVKILAEQAGLASINIESEQIVLRYPPLPPGVAARNLPPIGFGSRTGKNAYWLPMNNNGYTWQECMLGALKSIIAE